MQKLKGTHTKFYWGEYLQGQEGEGGVTGWGDLGYKADEGIQKVRHHPNPRKGGEQPGQEEGLGIAMGDEPLGSGGLRGL